MRYFDNKKKLAKITFILNLIHPVAFLLLILTSGFSRFYLFTLWVPFYNSLFQIIYIRRELPKKNIILILINVLLIIILLLTSQIAGTVTTKYLLKMMVFPFGLKHYRI